MERIGNRIYRNRKDRKITQIELAKKMGLAVQTLIEIEHDRLPVGQATYDKALDAMNEIAKSDKEAVA